MPNLKLYVDETQYQAAHHSLSALLPVLRDLLCARFSVEPIACQMAVIPVMGVPDQPQINAELHLLPACNRTPDVVRGAAHDVRACIQAATNLSVAVRIATLDPATYIALK